MKNFTNFSDQVQLKNFTGGTLLHAVTGPKWTFLPTFYVVVASLAFLGNGSVMIALICRKSLRTPFNIYLMNLVTANFLHAIIHSPADIINHLYSGWWLGDAYCSLYMYATGVFEAGIRVCHFLITINRIWAVMWPHSYRTRHGRWTAGLLCLGGWLYVHALLLPGYIPELLYYRKPLIVNPCMPNQAAQWVWAVVMQFLVFNMTLIVMLGAYPLIWYKRKTRFCSVKPGKHSAALGTQGTVKESLGGSEEVKTGEKKVVDAQTDARATFRVDGGRSSVEVAYVPKRSSHAFTILTVLTVSVTVCWSPLLCYYTINIWIPLRNQLFLQFAIVLFSLQAVLDPILFVAALPPLRETFRLVLRESV